MKFILCLSLFLSLLSSNNVIANPPGKKVADNSTMPLSFIENKGQITDQFHNSRPDVQFKMEGAGGLNVFIGNGALHFQFCRMDSSRIDKQTTPYQSPARLSDIKSPATEPTNYVLYRMDAELIGTNKNAQYIAEQKQDYYENYFRPGMGANGAIAYTYNKITYKEIYPHIDWVLYSKDGKLKHEFVIKDGGKVSDIKIKYGGTTGLKVNSDGSLTAITPEGTITEQAPFTFQQDGRSVKSNFILNGDTLNYATGEYTGELVIDPFFQWERRYGSPTSVHNAYAYSVATDNNGYVYLAGYANSNTTDIATVGAYQTTVTGIYYDAFLVKSNSSGIRQWGTYYGGTGDDVAYAVAVDFAGNVFISGSTTNSSGMASTGAYQAVNAGGYDAYLVKFNSSGIRRWATYYGGSNSDVCNALAVDSSGNVYMGGVTSSTSGIASPGALQTVYGGGSNDGFFVKFDSSGTRQWATYYGGIQVDKIQGVAVDTGGNIYITGSTSSDNNIVTTGAFQTLRMSTVGFLAKFNSSGIRQWGTYYGGTSGITRGNAVTTDLSGRIYIAGMTEALDTIATPGAYHTNRMGLSDGFVAKFNTNGYRLWGTYYGGNNDDELLGVATGSTGNISVVGYTNSTSGLALTGAYLDTLPTGTIVPCLALLDTTGVMLYSTYYGLSIYPYFHSGHGQAAAAAGNSIYMAAYDNNNADAILVKFDTCSILHPSVISGLSTVCPGSTITLTDSTTGGTWSSSNGHASVVGGILTGITAGTDTISYAVSSLCGATVAVTKIITVNPMPGTITGTFGICNGTTTTLFDATSGGTWSSSNILIAAVGSISGIVSGNAVGSVVITYTLSNGCYVTTNFTVNPMPASIAGASIACAGSAITLTDATSGGTWSSSNTAVATIALASGIVSAVSGGTTTISYNLATGCAVSTVITINLLPAAISGSFAVCAGFATTLSDATTGGTWTSATVTIATIGSANGIVSGISAGTSKISYILPTGCSVSVIVTVYPIPSLSSTLTPPDICDSTVFSYDPTSAIFGTIFNWYRPFVAGITLPAGTGTGNPNEVLDNTTFSPVTVSYIFTLSAGGCSGTDTVRVVVIPTPYLSSSTALSPICDSTLLNYTPSSFTTGVGFNWSRPPVSGITPATASGTGVISETLLNSTVAAVPVVYTYTLTVGGCVHIENLTVTVNPFTTAGSISGVDTVCEGATTTLTDAIAGGTWSSGSNVSVAGGVVTGITAGSDIVSYTVSDSCGTAVATLPITVVPAAVCNNMVSGVSNVSELLVYPNPNNGTFAINLISAERREVHVVITNIVGEKVEEFTSTTNKVNNVTLNCASGIYLLCATTDRGKYVAKLTIRK